MNCSNIITNINCCIENNLIITVPFLIFAFVSFIFNIISCSFWVKSYQEKKKRKKRLAEIKKARERKKKKFSEKNLEYQIYVKRGNSSIPEWAYEQYMDDASI